MTPPVPQQLLSRWRRFTPDQGGSMENAIFYLQSHGYRFSGKEILSRIDRIPSTGDKSALTFLISFFGFKMQGLDK